MKRRILPLLMLIAMLSLIVPSISSAQGYVIKRDPSRPLVVLYPPESNGYRKVLIFDPFKTSPSRSFYIDANNHVVNPPNLPSASVLAKKYGNDIEKNAIAYGVDPALVKAVIHAESGFNPKAVSHVGAAGLMQLMPATAKSMGVKNRFNPKENISGGVRYLATLLKTFGNPKLAIAAYNAGEGAVFKYGGIPPYKETKHYVNKVMSLWMSYRQQG